MADETTGKERTSHLSWIMAAALLVWIVVLTTCAQLQTSPTFDEQNHVTRGIAILRTGDYGFCYHHPPLANILEALPVAWGRHGFSTASAAWQNRQNPREIWPAAFATIWAPNPAAGIRIIQLARVPVLLFTLALALVVFLWARELFGPWGGVLSLGLFALDPSVLAHSGLATTDMAAACTIVLALYLLRRHLFAPSRARLAFAGVSLGLALTAKFSTLILLPLIALLLLAFVWRAPGLPGSLPARWAALSPGRRLLRAVGTGLLILLIGCVTLWAIYGFHVEALGSKAGQPFRARASFTERLPIPAFQYLRGIKAVKTEAKDKPAYLFGHLDTSGKGWWYYFPVTVATKTPLPELLLILGMLGLLTVPRLRARLAPRRELLFLLLPVLIYALAAMGALGISWNMGIRHLLPVYPFLLILAGGWVRVFSGRRAAGWVLGGLLVLQCVAVLAAYPGYLSYFNELAGERGQGYRIFVDSNLDWGQDLGRLGILQRERGYYPLLFSYFGSTPPEACQVACTPIAGYGIMDEAPPPDLAGYRGYLAISVTNLMAGGAKVDGVKVYCHYDYRPLLLRRSPVAQAGSTILVYQFP